MTKKAFPNLNVGSCAVPPQEELVPEAIAISLATGLQTTILSWTEAINACLRTPGLDRKTGRMLESAVVHLQDAWSKLADGADVTKTLTRLFGQVQAARKLRPDRDVWGAVDLMESLRSKISEASVQTSEAAVPGFDPPARDGQEALSASQGMRRSQLEVCVHLAPFGEQCFKCNVPKTWHEIHCAG